MAPGVCVGERLCQQLAHYSLLVEPIFQVVLRVRLWFKQDSCNGRKECFKGLPVLGKCYGCTEHLHRMRSSLAVTYPRVWLLELMLDSVSLIHSFVLFCGVMNRSGNGRGQVGGKGVKIQVTLQR